MAEEIYPVIVELYGLPGCGKTTLRDNLVKEYGRRGAFCLMTELSQQYRRLPLHKKIQYIPFRSWWRVLCFLLSMPKLPLRDWRFYKAFFTFALVYNFSKNAKGEGYIVIDHGFLQALVSLMHGHTNELTEKQREVFFKILSMMPDCIFVYCRLSASTSLHRVRVRKRDVGRLDLIKSDEILMEKLKIQERIFDTLHDAMQRYGGIQNFMIDSEVNQKECAERLKHIVSHEY